MSYTLSTTEEGDIVIASVRGENTRANVLAYTSEILRRCVANRYTKVLVDEYLEGPSLQTSEIFDIIASAGWTPEVSSLRIGYVDSNKSHNRDKLRFAETVAANRGIRLRLFSGIEEAKTWLRETD